MFPIRNKHDLRLAYELLNLLSGRPSFNPRPIKAGIRAYLKSDDGRFPNFGRERRIVCDDGFDGYLELVELPEVVTDEIDARDYFEACIEIRMLPSAYDCTGKRSRVGTSCSSGAVTTSPITKYALTYERSHHENLRRNSERGT